jgi:hypothetical protein
VGVAIAALAAVGRGATTTTSHPQQGIRALSAGKILIEELRIPDELIGRSAFSPRPPSFSPAAEAWTHAVAWELA